MAEQRRRATEMQSRRASPYPYSSREIQTWWRKHPDSIEVCAVRFSRDSRIRAEIWLRDPQRAQYLYLPFWTIDPRAGLRIVAPQEAQPVPARWKAKIDSWLPTTASTLLSLLNDEKSGSTVQALDAESESLASTALSADALALRLAQADRISDGVSGSMAAVGACAALAWRQAGYSASSITVFDEDPKALAIADALIDDARVDFRTSRSLTSGEFDCLIAEANEDWGALLPCLKEGGKLFLTLQDARMAEPVHRALSKQFGQIEWLGQAPYLALEDWRHEGAIGSLTEGWPCGALAVCEGYGQAEQPSLFVLRPPMRPSLSVVVNAARSSSSLSTCLASVNDWADEVLVRKSDEDHAEAQCEWTLSLESTERLTAECREFIDGLLALSGDCADAFKLPCRSYFLDRWIVHAFDWYPGDRGARLTRNGAEISRMAQTPNVPPQCAVISTAADTIESFLQRAAVAAKEVAALRQEGGFSWKEVGERFVSALGSGYFETEGYRDGHHGLLLSWLGAFVETLPQLMILEEKLKRGSLAPVEDELPTSGADLLPTDRFASLSRPMSPPAAIMSKVIESLSPVGFENALEIHCGDGSFLSSIRYLAKNRTGIDPDPYLTVANLDSSRAFVPTRWQDAEFEPGQFDLIVCQRLPDGEELAFIQHVSPWLARDGSLILAAPTKQIFSRELRSLLALEFGLPSRSVCLSDSLSIVVLSNAEKTVKEGRSLIVAGKDRYGFNTSDLSEALLTARALTDAGHVTDAAFDCIPDGEPYETVYLVGQPAPRIVEQVRGYRCPVIRLLPDRARALRVKLADWDWSPPDTSVDCDLAIGWTPEEASECAPPAIDLAAVNACQKSSADPQLPDGKFYLFVGDIDATSNLANVLLAVKNSKTKLVVIGRSASPQYGELCRQTAGSNVLFLGPRSPVDAMAAMRRAAVVVAPTLASRPSDAVLWATAIGVPCVVQNTPVCHEILGARAVYCDPLDPASIMEAAKSVKKVRANSAAIDWSERAARIVEVGERPLARRSSKKSKPKAA